MAEDVRRIDVEERAPLGLRPEQETVRLLQAILYVLAENTLPQHERYIGKNVRRRMRSLIDAATGDGEGR